MDISKYYLATPGEDNTIILYSTFSTALISLSLESYKKIFVENDFETDSSLVQQLISLGFLVEDPNKQSCLLDKIYRREMNDKTPVVKIFTTNKCNARCYYCFEKGIKFIDMTPDVADATIDFIKRFYPDKDLQINWFGGEPLMNFPVIRRITDDLISSGFSLTTHVTTNGSLLSQDYIDYLLRNYRKVSVQVTIDDIGKNYAKVKQYVDISEDEAYNRVILNTHLLLKSGVSTRIRINFHKRMIERGMFVYESLREEFKDSHNLVIYLAPLTFDNEPTNNPESEHTHLKLMRFYAKHDVVFDEKNLLKSELSSLSLKPKAIPCGSCRTKNLTITAEGHIYKCHRIAKYPNCQIGDVRNGLDENSPFYKLFVTPEDIDKDCVSCAVYPICRGGCKVVSQINHEKKKTCDIYAKHSELVRLYYDKITSG